MNIKRLTLYMCLLMTALLAVFSVAGAFMGAQGAKMMFNSLPLIIFWAALALLLLAGFMEFPGLRSKAGLLLIHLGCLLILIGGMWSSHTAHRLRSRYFHSDKVEGGYMLIEEGSSDNRITGEDFHEAIAELPFSIALEDFRVEYYPPGKDFEPSLIIQVPGEDFLQIPAKAGSSIILPNDKGSLQITETYESFRITMKDGESTAADEGTRGRNPALKVLIETPQADIYSRYVFSRFAGFGRGDNELQLFYQYEPPLMVRDYFSDLTVIEDGEAVKCMTIEVNKPLYYGGYHFYQHSYDSEAGRYTILSVTSESGLQLVYAGYWALCGGVIWQLWVKRLQSFFIAKENKTGIQV